MQKGFAHLLILLVVGLISIFLIFSFRFGLVKPPFSPPLSPLPKVQPVSNPTSNLSNYSNQKLGFKFQHPETVSVKEDSEEKFNRRGNGNYRKNFTGYVGYEPGKFVGAVAVLDKSDSFENSPFTVWVFENPEKLDREEWFDRYWYYPFLWGVFDDKSKEHVRAEKIATISGQATKYVTVSYQPGSPKYLYLSNKGKMYLLKVIGEPGNNILSTFKFLE